MKQDDFEFYRKLLYERSGLALTPEKTYLLEGRLKPVAKKHGYETLDAFTNALKGSCGGAIVKEVIEAMATNETLFFRDEKPFRYFRGTILPEVIRLKARQKKLRIWSAACSTGQEPYSILMTVADLLPDFRQWNIEILATDLSEKALAQARKGEYSQFEVQRGLPIQAVMDYFVQTGSYWKVSSDLRDRIRFENFNLLDPMSGKGIFDLIFCRHVLIYFDAATKKRVLRGLSQQLSSEGYMFLGGSESAVGILNELQSESACPGLYRPVRCAASAGATGASDGQAATGGTPVAAKGLGSPG